MWEAAWRSREGSGASLVIAFLPWTPPASDEWAPGGQDPRPGRESLTLSRVHPESSADNPASPRREPKAVDGRDAAPCLGRSQAHRNAHPERSASAPRFPGEQRKSLREPQTPPSEPKQR